MPRRKRTRAAIVATTARGPRYSPSKLRVGVRRWKRFASRPASPNRTRSQRNQYGARCTLSSAARASRCSSGQSGRRCVAGFSTEAAGLCSADSGLRRGRVDFGAQAEEGEVESRGDGGGVSGIRESRGRGENVCRFRFRGTASSSNSHDVDDRRGFPRSFFWELPGLPGRSGGSAKNTASAASPIERKMSRPQREKNRTMCLPAPPPSPGKGVEGNRDFALRRFRSGIPLQGFAVMLLALARSASMERETAMSPKRQQWQDIGTPGPLLAENSLIPQPVGLNLAERLAVIEWLRRRFSGGIPTSHRRQLLCRRGRSSIVSDLFFRCLRRGSFPFPSSLRALLRSCLP